jgi:regulator of cell morphogenesis and NO signaling
MRVSPNTTIRQIALHVPGSTGIFQQEGIDFCGADERTLEEACVEADVSFDYLARRLESLTAGSDEQPIQNWQIEPLFLLTSHIVTEHHEYARHELPRLAQQAMSLAAVEGEERPELGRIEVLLRAMTREFNIHMMREEQMIFPYIVQLEAADREDDVPPQAPAGSAENPLRGMMAEHDSAIEMLRELRYLTDNFTPSPDSGAPLERLYNALRAFEADMQQHIHLEDNVLFPRALDMESATQPAVLVRPEEAV